MSTEETTWYVDSEDLSAFCKATSPYQAFTKFIREFKENAGHIPVKIYKTVFFNDMLIGHGDPVWTEHPEGDPLRNAPRVEE